VPAVHVPGAQVVLLFDLSPESIIADRLTVVCRITNEMKITFAQF
jgi:hypothetical protein